MVKLYVISLIQGSMTVYSPSVGGSQVILKETFMLGLIVFGNIVDNVSQPLWVAIFAQVFLGVSWILIGGLV